MAAIIIQDMTSQDSSHDGGAENSGGFKQQVEVIGHQCPGKAFGSCICQDSPRWSEKFSRSVSSRKIFFLYMPLAMMW
jgi:hypothetical protein